MFEFLECDLHILHIEQCSTVFSSLLYDMDLHVSCNHADPTPKRKESIMPSLSAILIGKGSGLTGYTSLSQLDVANQNAEQQSHVPVQ